MSSNEEIYKEVILEFIKDNEEYLPLFKQQLEEKGGTPLLDILNDKIKNMIFTTPEEGMNNSW